MKQDIDKARVLKDRRLLNTIIKLCVLKLPDKQGMISSTCVLILKEKRSLFKAC
jgi:hypothetical protein